MTDRPPLMKILVIGLDGAEPTLLEQWMESGDAPNLTKLGLRSIKGVVRNPYALEAGSYDQVSTRACCPPSSHSSTGGAISIPRSKAISGSARAVPPRTFGNICRTWGKRRLIVDAPYVCVDPSLNGAGRSSPTAAQFGRASAMCGSRSRVKFAARCSHCARLSRGRFLSM